MNALFRSTRAIPDEFRSNFINLYFDVGWFGLLNGSLLAFLSIYAARLGASPIQLGLINSGPAVINMIFALPAGLWLAQQPIRQAVSLSALINRLFYIPFILMPFFLSNPDQVTAIIIVTLVMSLPGTLISVGFNELFACAVPVEWRGQVVATRNAILSAVSVVTSLVCGQLLANLPFSLGYQIVFGLGAMGGIMTAFHLWRVRVVSARLTIKEDNETGTAPKRPGLKERLSALGRLNVLQGHAGKVLGLLFLFHFMQFLAIPIFPIYSVRTLGLADNVLGFGTAAFQLTVFIGSTQLVRWIGKWGNKKVTGIGIALLAIFPALLVISNNVGMYLLTNTLGGIAWSFVGGALTNYLLEKAPDRDRTLYLSWYNIVLNAGILGGSFVGPLLAESINMPFVLLLCAFGRLIAGLAVLRWG